MPTNSDYSFNRFAVIFGLVPPGLNVVRELGEKKVPVLGVTRKGASEIGRYSKYIDRLIEYENFNELLVRLLDFGKHQKERPILIPVRDDYLFFIADHYEFLIEHFDMQGAYEPSMIRSIVDKKYFYRNLEKTAIPFPETFVAEDLSMDEIFSLEEKLPLIAKPRCIHKYMRLMRRNKVIQLNRKKDIEAFVRQFKDRLSDWLFQEVVPGPATHIYVQTGYVSPKKDHLIHFNGRKLKQLPEDFGVAAKMISEKNKTVEILTLKLLTHLNYHGVYDTEFKWDERDKTFKLMEINPRSPLWIGIASAAGFLINYVSYRDIQNLPLTDEIPVEQKDVLWTYQEKCLISWFQGIFKKKSQSGVTDFIIPSCKKKTGPVWSPLDLCPSLTLFPFYLKKIAKKLSSLI